MKGISKHTKDLFSSCNLPLFKLKMCFFLVYSVWHSSQPYIAIIPTHIITFNQLAMLYAIIPAFSIMAPIITGFLADKIGNYKSLIICGLLMGGIAPFGMLWLHSDHRDYILNTNNSNFTSTIIDDEDPITDNPIGTEPDPQPYTFPLLIFFRIICFLTFDSTNTLLDVCGLTMCKEHGGDFARQKLWGAGSMVVAPLICGTLVDWVSEYLGYIDYSVAFYVGAGIMLAVIPLISKLDVKVEKNESSMMVTVKKVIGMIDLDIFILVEVVVGIMFGFHMNFRPVFIHSEKIGSKTLMGLCLTAFGIGTMMVLTTAKTTIGKLGEPNTVIIGLVLYCLRFVGYYFLTNPWIFLLSEFFEGFSGFLSVVAGSYYCASAAPPSMLASLSGILSGAIFGAGRGLGTSVGSALIHKYGLRTTYLLFGCLAGATAVVYFIVYHLFLKKIRDQRLALETQGSEKIFGIDNPVVELEEEKSVIKLA